MHGCMDKMVSGVYVCMLHCVEGMHDDASMTLRATCKQQKQIHASMHTYIHTYIRTYIHTCIGNIPMQAC
jgi:hypothetical protein